MIRQDALEVFSSLEINSIDLLMFSDTESSSAGLVGGVTAASVLLGISQPKKFQSNRGTHDTTLLILTCFLKGTTTLRTMERIYTYQESGRPEWPKVAKSDATAP